MDRRGADPGHAHPGGLGRGTGAHDKVTKSGTAGLPVIHAGNTYAGPMDDQIRPEILQPKRKTSGMLVPVSIAGAVLIGVVGVLLYSVLSSEDGDGFLRRGKLRGEGLALTWGWAPTPFGRGLFVMTPRGLAGLGFEDLGRGIDAAAAFEDMRRRWPAADWARDDALAAKAARQAFLGEEGPLPIHLIGPPFHIQVWKALLRIPSGATATYADVARWAGKPGAFRATGAAVGANPISLLIPCHRVVRSDGGLGGYRWGETRKRKLLAQESAGASR